LAQCSVHALLLFFFQAEDGIRGPLVTGVQTCALPISLVGRQRGRLVGGGQVVVVAAWVAFASGLLAPAAAGRRWPGRRGRVARRSEERRVGNARGERWVRGELWGSGYALMVGTEDVVW